MTIRKTFLIASAFYFALAIFFFPYLYNTRISPDTVAYISIAKKYAAGNFTGALNGCWSPLISWLLAIPSSLGCDAIKSFAILQLLIGWFALYQWVLLCRRNISSVLFQSIVIFAGVPSLLVFAWNELTADALLVAMTLFYLNTVSRPGFFLTKNFGVLAGILGLFFYLIKSFGFFFFIAHLFIITLKKFLENKDVRFRKHILKNYLVAMIIFLLTSASWIMMISKKYGHFTISEAAAFNLSKETAPLPEQYIRMPILWSGITVPADTSSVIAWEDPTLVIHVTPLHPFSDNSDFIFYRQLLKRNLLTIYYYDFRRQTGAILLLVFILFLVTGGAKKLWQNNPLFILLCTLVLFYGGYSLVLVHTRYVWINTLLMLLLATIFIEHIRTKSRAMKVAGTLLFVVMIMLAVKHSAKELFFSRQSCGYRTVLTNAFSSC
jgi:hypothetical protein